MYNKKGQTENRNAQTKKIIGQTRMQNKKGNVPLFQRNVTRLNEKGLRKKQACLTSDQISPTPTQHVHHYLNFFITQIKISPPIIH